MTEISTVPQHVGIIMDGNRRWAKEQGLAAVRGHAMGQKVLRNIVDHAFRRGVRYLTVYAFSAENWNRASEEVGYLMRHVALALQKYIGELHEAGVKVVILGSRDNLPARVLSAIKNAEEKTANNTKATFSICFNYGGHQEILDAAKALVKSGVRADSITLELIEQHLYQPELPPLDLVIRTSGEQRLSGFMLWRASYSEFIFREEYWPEFSQDNLDECLLEYSNRQRRYGA